MQHYRYNRRGLLSGIERDNTPAATFLYDDFDRLTERHIAHEKGVQIRRWEYEGTRDTPARVVYEDGSETRFGYDVEGNLTAVTDALGQRYQFRYGAFDNLLEATDPLGATVRYHYNAQAEFAGVTNSLGREWTYGFDSSGRLSEERHYDGRVYRYRYDLAGRLIKAANLDAVVEYAYNRAGQVIAETVNGEVITSDYDASGQRARVEGILAPLQLAWASGRVTALGIGTHQPVQFSHTSSGEEQRRSNGSGFALRQEWSPTGLLQRQALEGADGRVIECGYTQYRYDDCGRIVIKRETRPGFRPKETHYTWDVQDRLVRVSLPDGARWRYGYDAFGRRVSKVREGQVSSAQAVARVAYRWDGDQLVGQHQYLADGTAAREVQWVYEPGSFRPLAQVEGKGDVTRLHYIVTDLTGTARELCSEGGGGGSLAR
ncbi:MAG: hypothetical protein ACMZI0_20655 [Symbiopectobacterium sp.]|uniref:hypothetical protein n=1 Tax=Symbiopectobacterium sp. TaxID=2952789 RepID=UPI0039E76427